MLTALAVVVAALLEAALGEPPTRLHPVAWFGSLVAPLDRPWGRFGVIVGALGGATLPLVAGAVVAATVVAGLSLSMLAGSVVAGVALFLTTSLRRLLDAASAVIDDTETDLDAAREGLLALAGRDASNLSAAHLRSAAVESAAENLADGLIAPLGVFVFAALFAPFGGLPALPAAAGAAAWVKAVNTMDSMLGYREKRVGTAAARLDDVVMWIPARVSALVLAVVFVDLRALLRARRWLDRVPSPNSGWPMGVAAAALSVRLEKPGVYVLNDDAELPDTVAARRGVRGVGLAGVASYVLAGVIAWF